METFADTGHGTEYTLKDLTSGDHRLPWGSDPIGLEQKRLIYQRPAVSRHPGASRPGSSSHSER
jgi:hypothetical protein